MQAPSRVSKAMQPSEDRQATATAGEAGAPALARVQAATAVRAAVEGARRLAVVLAAGIAVVLVVVAVAVLVIVRAAEEALALVVAGALEEVLLARGAHALLEAGGALGDREAAGLDRVEDAVHAVDGAVAEGRLRLVGPQGGALGGQGDGVVAAAHLEVEAARELPDGEEVHGGAGPAGVLADKGFELILCLFPDFLDSLAHIGKGGD